ncbi:TetR/AcrR family transcriptional regulator [Devosia lacusdianchii]|uniref:TetR/AcrR family transcriptional regulator n=1 Tax=Devosia lacusdianchii TaxID=2917991 RepID=UPI001F069E54|nr:TetR/AcrR family transcriptional regulator [Devosia sp. JXJ CY 41]
MGRKQTIDRGAILDAAERVVLRSGAASLTIDAVAKEAGVSKGGVLYAFTTKDALISAMLNRVTASYDTAMEAQLAALGDAPLARPRAHVAASRDEDAPSSARALALMASFIRAPDYQKETQQYYRELMASADPASEAGRRARLALLATEGAFIMRGFGLYAFSEEEWHAIHQDIVAILLD